jgi:hypothetical protein
MPADLDRLIAAYRAGIVAALVENAERAYLVGDLIGQRRMHRAARGITNARKRVKDYDFDPPKTAGGFKLTFGEVAKEALAYLTDYTGELERGGTTIGGKWVPWLEDHSADMRTKIADALANGVREGLGHDDVVRSLGKVLDGERWKLERIARTETSRIQRTGMIARYTDAGVPKVRRLLGANPCPDCLADKDGIYEIDSVPEDHVGGFCDWQPLVTAPIDRDALMPPEEVDRVLEAE